MELIIITGQSGAGKSKAIACMEDMGYYCVDNLPPIMISDLIDHLSGDESISKIALVTDIRSRKFFADLGTSLERLSEEGIEYKIMYLEASEKTLLMRYQETRRNHPLAEDGNIERAIDSEREILEPIRSRADYIINTSTLNNAGLYNEISRLLNFDNAEKFRISISSFGFKHGLPAEADWVLDVRFIPNPYYVESLKNLTGRNKKVKEFVLGFAETESFIARVTGEIIELIPKYIREGKYHLDIAIGCTGGKHRSVVVAEALAEHLRECDQSVTLSHREL